MARRLALLLAVVGWCCSTVALLAGLLWGLTLKCDDSCGGEGWRRDPRAWQWNGLAALGVVVFVAAGVVVFFVWRRRPLLAGGAVLVALLAMAGLANGFSRDWTEHLGRRSGAELLLLSGGVLAPVFAVLLTGRQPSSFDAEARDR